MSIITGDVGPLVSLQAARRAAWERLQRQQDERIARRAKDGPNMADPSEWGQIADEAGKASAAIEKRDSDALVAACARLIGLASPAPKPLPAYEDRPRLNGVRVAFRLLSQAQARRLEAPLRRLGRAASKLTDDDVEQYLEADAGAYEAQLEFIRHTVARIEVERDGVTWSAAGDVLDDGALRVIERLKIAPDLFTCAREAQDLDPFELATFGASQPLTSPTSSAPDARSSANPSSGASMLAPSASEGPNTSRGLAPGESSSAIQTSPSSSSFTAAPMEGSAGSTSLASL